MEGNVYSKAMVAAASQSYDKMRSWINSLTQPRARNLTSSDKKGSDSGDNKGFSFVKSENDILDGSRMATKGHHCEGTPYLNSDSPYLWQPNYGMPKTPVVPFSSSLPLISRRQSNTDESSFCPIEDSDRFGKIRPRCVKRTSEVGRGTVGSIDSGYVTDLLMPSPMVRRTSNSVRCRADDTETENEMDSYTSRRRTLGPHDLSTVLDHCHTKEPSPTSTTLFDYKTLDAAGGEQQQQENKSESCGRRVSVNSITTIRRCRRVLSENKNSDTYSKNYSLYVEHVVINVCSEHVLSKQDSFTSNGIQNDRMSEFTISNATLKIPTTNRASGSIKLCLQYFESIKTLRVILLNACNLETRKKGYIYPKLTVFSQQGRMKKQKVALPKVKASTNVVFNEVRFFENIDEDAVEELLMKVKLYHKEGILKSRRYLGEIVIPIFKYDLSMDTIIKGTLRRKQSQKIPEYTYSLFEDDDDIEVQSDDKSISAKVTAAVNPGSPFFIHSPRVCVRRRVNSLPLRGRYGTKAQRDKI